VVKLSPGDSTKIRGVKYIESAKETDMSKVGGSTNCGPIFLTM